MPAAGGRCLPAAASEATVPVTELTFEVKVRLRWYLVQNLVRKADRVSGPAFPLKDLQVEIEEGNVAVFRKSALERIMKALSCSLSKAHRTARAAALQLEAEDYSHTLKYPDGTLADVYGKELRVG